MQSEYTEVLSKTEPVFEMPLMPLRKVTITHPERSEDGRDREAARESEGWGGRTDNVSDAGAPRCEREGAVCCCDGERAQDFSVSTAASKAASKAVVKQ